MFALICPNCGGPLPSSAPSAAQVSCDYCSIVLVPAEQEFKPLEGSSARPPDAERQRLRHTFNEAVKNSLDAGGEPAAVLGDALRQHFGPEMETGVVVAVVMGLNEEFRADTGIDTRRDVMALVRLAEAYLSSQDQLAASGRASFNLPFFGADSSGPKHFARELTVADIQALARGEVAPSRAAAEPKKKKKKGWWPF